MPQERSSEVDNGRSQYQGAGIPHHPEAPPALGQNNEPRVPDQISNVAQMIARLRTLGNDTAEQEAEFVKSLKLSNDELYEVLGAVLYELGSLRMTVNRMLKAGTEVNKRSLSGHLRNVAESLVEESRRLPPDFTQRQTQLEEHSVEDEPDVILQPGDDLLPGEEEEVGEQAETPLSLRGK